MPMPVRGHLVLTLTTFIAAILVAACGGPIEPQKVEKTASPAPSAPASPVASKSSKTSTPSPVVPAQAAAKAPAKPTVFAIGDTVKMGSLQLTVNGVRKSQGDDFFRPKSGNVFLAVDATLENLTDKPEPVSSMLMFSVADSEGFSYKTTILPDVKGQLDGEVAPGRKMRGEIAFEVPIAAKGVELLFKPSPFVAGQAIVKLGDISGL